MNNNIELVDIRAFVTISNYKSFTKAADTLNVSRSHLSRQLKKLETALDTQLVIRTTRSLRLTDEGQSFYRKCHESLLGIESAVSSLKNQNQSLRGTIKVNCVGGVIGEDIFANLLSKFVIQYPEISIELSFSSERVDLLDGDYHLVVRMGELEDSSLIARKLTDLTIEALASSKYKRGLKLKHPKELKNENCIVGSIKKWSFIQDGKNKKTFDLQVDGNFTCKNGRAMINAALNGLGIIRVPTIYCKSYIDTKELVPVFNSWKIKTVPIYILYHSNNNQTERLKKLIEYLVQSFN